MPKSTRRIPFVFVDVFAEEPLSGNSLVVVPDAQVLQDRDMQKIAREMPLLSETVFYISDFKRPIE